MPTHRTARIASASIFLASIALCAPTVIAADVWTVPGPGTPTVQAAVDLAQPGDIVLVAAGTPSENVVVDGKGITLVADGTVTLKTLALRHVPDGQLGVLHGFVLDAPATTFGARTPLLLEHNAGELRIQHCTARGDGGFAGIWPLGLWPFDAAAGARIEASSASLHRCTFTGGSGADLDDEDSDGTATAGASGLIVIDGRVAVFDCVSSGGRGGSLYDTVSTDGRVGGSGIEAHATRLDVHGSLLTGGDGGDADCDIFACGHGGDGGHGLAVLDAGSSATTRDDAYFPGTGGDAFDSSANDGVDGLDVFVGASTSHVELPAAYRGFDATSPVREGSSLTLTYEAEVGDALLLLVDFAPSHLSKPAKQGVLLLGGAMLTRLDLGTMPDGLGGMLGVSVLAPELGPGVDGLDVHLQAAVIADGLALLGPAQIVTLLDASF